MDTINCIHCNTANDPQASNWWYCSKCGKRLPGNGAGSSTRREAPGGDRSAAVLEYAPANRAWSPPKDLGPRDVALRGVDGTVIEELPPICACCGKPATLTVEKMFGWYPPARAGAAFLLIGVWGMALFRKTMTVRLPVCQAHRRPWLRQHLLLAAFIFHMCILSWGILVLFVFANDRWGMPTLGWAIMLTWPAIAVVLFVWGFVVARKAIRPKWISEDTLVLSGVSEAFASCVSRDAAAD
jgi:hypothetical protein